MTKYSFETSQPLTSEQLRAINSALNNLPFADLDEFEDLPEWTTAIEEES